MKPITAAPKGTKDILPAESHKWQHVEKTALDIASLYGFSEIRVPTFEHTELFLRGVGDTTDVVQKEMYTFKDKGDRSVTLRPEGTSGVMRAAVENNLLADKLPLKLSYNITCFRYEKPQAGRMREFHQFGVEEVGSPSPCADAEVISLAKRVLDSLGVKKVKLFINSIGCKHCRPSYQQKLKDYLKSREEELCDTCKERLVTNPLRVIDCKSPVCSEIVKGAPKMVDYLCDECREHFEEVKKRLDSMGIEYEVDTDIVRGLDYYTKTVFEFVTTEIGAQGTVCGGGRYDGLIEEIGGHSHSGVGFAMGIERLLLVMEKSNAMFPKEKECSLFIASMGKEASIKASGLVDRLRREGIYADCDSMERSLKAQMRFADKQGALFTVVLGEEELKNNKASLKDMATKEQREISLGEDFADTFSKLLIDKQLEDTLNTEFNK